jgi:hypothetical protein
MAASELDTAGDQSLEYWCHGCRRVGERALTLEEREWIDALRRGHLRRLLLGIVLLPATTALIALCLTLVPESTAGTWVIGIAAFATLGIVLPVSIALIRDHAVARGRLRRDLALGLAWVFEAPSEAMDAMRGGLRLVARPDERSSAVGGEPDAPQSAAAEIPIDFALLEWSRRVIRLSDLSLNIAPADVIEVEPHRGSRFYAPLSLEVISPTPDTNFGQRALSPSERAELARVSRRLMIPAFGTLIAIALLVLIVAMLKRLRPELQHAPMADFLSTGVAIALCIRSLVRHVRGMKLANRIREDLRLGLVVHVVQATRPSQEFLPASRLLWRSAGAPALWRDHRRAVARLRSGL